mmetsp:Transcript_11673/g.29150  ORF Transcript_11673/g.29150 Transcript_11673/m.29150 type:complete len:214 (-) Transcript_11673:48-689(-)
MEVQLAGLEPQQPQHQAGVVEAQDGVVDEYGARSFVKHDDVAEVVALGGLGVVVLGPCRDLHIQIRRPQALARHRLPLPLDLRQNPQVARRPVELCVWILFVQGGKREGVEGVRPNHRGNLFPVVCEEIQVPLHFWREFDRRQNQKFALIWSAGDPDDAHVGLEVEETSQDLEIGADLPEVAANLLESLQVEAFQACVGRVHPVGAHAPRQAC